MRVLYLLFLVPLGAFASCPAGLKLSSVPISTELPYCVKWETSTLGGCEVACPGVCVEVPASGTKGPIETTGGECALGGGGDGGGDTGGGNNGGTGTPSTYPFESHISPIRVGGANQEMTTTALKQLDEDFRLFANKNYGQGETLNATFKTFSNRLMNVTDALSTQINTAEEVGKTQFAILQSLVRSESNMQQLTNCITNPLDNNCGHLAGSSSGAVSTVDLSAIKGDVASLKAMQQSAMSTLGSIGGNTSSMSSNMGSMLGAIGSLQGSVNSVNSNISSQSGYLSQMNDNLYGIKYMLQDGLKNGWGNSGGGQGGSGDFNIDYSQMPGSGSNPLHVAGSEYNSTLCSGDASCAFDLEQITKKYDEEKEALKSQYLAIKDEMADIFRFDFYGSASVPKCFDLFSLFGNDYQVCPNVGGYWEILLALMLFIFYFIAFMIVAKR